jgi:hypothetical protein
VRGSAAARKGAKRHHCARGVQRSSSNPRVIRRCGPKASGSRADGRVQHQRAGGAPQETTGACGESAGNKLLGRLRPEPADQGEVIVGGEPLKKGVIQLLYAGTGRESRTISGPRAAAERDHVELTTPTGD